jgi:hypothetical protein
LIGRKLVAGLDRVRFRCGDRLDVRVIGHSPRVPVGIRAGTTDSDTLDTEPIEAGYEAGVLTLRIPIAERAKPRKIAIANADTGHQQIDA